MCLEVFKWSAALVWAVGLCFLQQTRGIWRCRNMKWL
jgi:hypothetical protein